MSLFVIVLLVGLAGLGLAIAILARPIASAGYFIALLPYSYGLSLIGYAHYRQLQVLQDAVMVIIVLALIFRQVPVGRGPLWLKLVLAGWVFLILVGLMNPRLLNMNVGLIGARGWLLYPSVILMGAAIANNSLCIDRYLRQFLLIGLPVVLIGLYDALQVAIGGKFFMIQFVPGSRGILVSNGGFDIGEGRLTRIYSIFPYPLAYFVFVITYFAIAISMTLSALGRERREALVLTVLGAVAALTSGTRLAVVFVPVILIAVSARSMDRKKAARLVVTVLPIGVVAFGVITGISILSLPKYLGSLMVDEFNFLIISGMSDSVSVTIFGLGPGMDSNAAAGSGGDMMYRDFGGKWRESLFAKSWLEFGVPGFAITIIFMVLCLALAWGTLRQNCEYWKRGVAALLFSFMLILPKGSIIERAPAGIYFWFAVGMLAFHASRAPSPRALTC